MPNHVHGIIVLRDDVGDVPVGAKHSGDPFGGHVEKVEAGMLRPHGTQPRSLGAIIQNFKSVSSRKINRVLRSQDTPVWQRNYYEHIIRNEVDLQRIRRYILDNPARWDTDENNPRRT